MSVPPFVVHIAKWAAGELIKKVTDNSEQALMVVAERIFSESQDEVPWDTGELARSGSVKRTGEKQVTIRYSKEYAAKQHEEASYSHPGGRKMKYLEDPLKRNFSTVIKEVGNAVRITTRGG